MLNILFYSILTTCTNSRTAKSRETGRDDNKFSIQPPYRHPSTTHVYKEKKMCRGAVYYNYILSSLLVSLLVCHSAIRTCCYILILFQSNNSMLELKCTIHISLNCKTGAEGWNVVHHSYFSITVNSKPCSIPPDVHVHRYVLIYVVSCPDPTCEERVWWHPTDSSGFSTNS